MNTVQHETSRPLTIGDLFTRYQFAPINPGDLIKVRITRQSDGTSHDVTLGDLMRNMRLTYEEHAGILGGGVVTLGEGDAAISVSTLHSP